jgi:hypothetical protein
MFTLQAISATTVLLMVNDKLVNVDSNVKKSEKNIVFYFMSNARQSL